VPPHCLHTIDFNENAYQFWDDSTTSSCTKCVADNSIYNGFNNSLRDDSTTSTCGVVNNVVHNGFSNFHKNNLGGGEFSHFHNSFGFVPFSPLIVSQNVSLPTITPSIGAYLAINTKYSGIPNFLAKVAPVASHINVQLFRALGHGFHDQQIFDLIQYGFPLDLDKSNFIPNSAVANHGSAIKFPAEVDNYFSEEIGLGSILGPFEDSPFPDLHCSPLMTAPKDGNKRRIIVDLSYSSSQGHSVNSTVLKNSYVGTHFGLKLPTAFARY
jgi:hypothetical protein